MRCLFLPCDCMFLAQFAPTTTRNALEEGKIFLVDPSKDAKTTKIFILTVIVLTFLERAPRCCNKRRRRRRHTRSRADHAREVSHTAKGVRLPCDRVSFHEPIYKYVFLAAMNLRLIKKLFNYVVKELLCLPRAEFYCLLRLSGLDQAQ